MALVCNKVSKITNFFRSSLKTKLNSFKSSQDKISIFNPFQSVNNPQLSDYLHYYQNFQNCQLTHENELESFLVNNIISSIGAKENYGSDYIVTSLKMFGDLYVSFPTNENKEILLKIIRTMNDSPEMFKNIDLERTVKLLSDNKFYFIKSEIKGLNFFKKTPKNKKNITMELEALRGNKYNINVDVENNLIVLTDKFNEDRQITFVELTHSGTTSLTLYQSLIKTMNPGVILVDQEPFLREDNLIKVDKFEDLQNFKNCIKENNLEIKNSHVVNPNSNSVCEIESIILSCLLSFTGISSKRKKVVLFDTPYHNYFNSFLHFSKSDINLDSIEKLEIVKERIMCLNLMEVNHWLSFQETLGCKSCASFLNKREVNWYPLHSEFLVNKNTLPNSNYMNNFKIKKIFDSLKDEKENIMIFASNTKSLCEGFLKYNEENNSNLEFEDYFNNSDLNSEYNREVLSLALHMKENHKKLYKDLPMKINKSKNTEALVNNLKMTYEKNYEELYCKNGSGDGLNNFYDEMLLRKQEDVEDINLDSGNKNKSFLKGKSDSKSPSLNKNKNCEPFEYIKSIIEFKNGFKL